MTILPQFITATANCQTMVHMIPMMIMVIGTISLRILPVIVADTSTSGAMLKARKGVETPSQVETLVLAVPIRRLLVPEELDLGGALGSMEEVGVTSTWNQTMTRVRIITMPWE